MKRVMLVEFSVFERILPLTSGYLQSYASMEPVVRGSYDFTHYTTTTRTPAERILSDLASADADVYAFSCYVWNMGLVKSILPSLREARPGAHILLGGPQVMHHAKSYLSPGDERAAVCNGEGEATFTEYLCTLTERDPRLEGVAGLSFYRDGELVTTPERPRIKNLDDIPSPFLQGVFSPGYSMSVIETNRGCPFHCGFCYWGAATNDRVYRFDEERVRDEISWMANHEILFLYIADANWGMLSRDITISEHIADCAREYRLPQVVYFSAAKNKPHAVTRIAGIFQDAGLVTSQPVSLQTLEPGSLDLIKRSNIKLGAFAEVQQSLKEKGISSYIELIWPLPGETLDSFRKGVDSLCGKDAQTIITYPHMLLNNTPIYHSRDSLGLRSRPVGGAADALVVIETQDVTEAEFHDGMRFFYAVHALHNTRALRTVGRYLVKHSILDYSELFSAFAAFLLRQPASDPVASYIEQSLRDAGYYDINNYGIFVHHLLHASRAAFGEHVRRFARSQPWWADEAVRALFEIDLLNRPYVYGNTPMDDLSGELTALRILGQAGRKYTVSVPEEYLPALADAVLCEGEPGHGTFTVDHKRMQYPFMPAQSMDHNGGYCHGMIEKINNIMPVWRAC